jgi:hypothetical protein
MATKKKPTADEQIDKAPPDSSAKPTDVVEVDWGKGFIEHKDAVVRGKSIKVPIPFNVRRAMGGTQTKGRYDKVRLKLNGQEVRVGERRFHKAPSEDLPSLTFDTAD